MDTNDGGPAFPIPIAGCSDGGVYNALQQSNGELGGMSLRDYFAAKAMQAAWADIPDLGTDRTAALEFLGRSSYEMADAMLAARAKAQP